MSVTIEKNKITAVSNGYLQPNKGDVVIDLKNKTVMPGLIDMHVHLELETKKGNLADRFILNPADIAF